MNIVASRPSFVLNPGELLRLDNAFATAIDVAAGSVWLTVDGVSDDIILDAGDAHVLLQQAPAIVQAVGSLPARVTLTERAAA